VTTICMSGMNRQDEERWKTRRSVAACRTTNNEQRTTSFLSLPLTKNSRTSKSVVFDLIIPS
jgi:hypothetical protein